MAVFLILFDLDLFELPRDSTVAGDGRNRHGSDVEEAQMICKSSAAKRFSSADFSVRIDRRGHSLHSRISRSSFTCSSERNAEEEIFSLSVDLRGGISIASIEFKASITSFWFKMKRI